MEKKIVVSGINIISGGALTVLEEFLSLLKQKKNFKIILLLNSKKIIKNRKDFEILEFPLSKKNYFFRIFYEYFFFYFLSKKLKPDIWFSMHDISPNILSKKRYVYCHNPSPFYKIEFNKIIYEKKFLLFYFFYSFFYKINIHKNDYVIVQQNWIKKEFKRKYKIDNILVVRPEINFRKNKTIKSNHSNKIKTFIYPSYPRFFKNFELIIKAVNHLSKNQMEKNFEVFFTISRFDNKYSKYLYSIADHNFIKFIGNQNKSELYKYYERVDALLFPSSLETWGLPLSEFKYTKKPILAIELPYSRENLANYEDAYFFAQNDYIMLSSLMSDIINNKSLMSKNKIQNFSDDYLYWDNFIDKYL